MLEGLSLDPYTVLGVSRGVSAEQVREAYRRKSMKYHPDHGGDDWAFRIVARAYEILIRDAAEAIRLPAAESDTGRIRPGVHDKAVDPERIVNVEILWMRYDVADYMTMLGPSTVDRNLSGSMTITWPDPSLADRAEALPQADRILGALNAAFDEARARPDVRGGHSHIDARRFEAWLGYANGHAAWLAFKNLHVGLKARGLGVKQWTRDMTVPRR
jgi:hypothetical protein